MSILRLFVITLNHGCWTTISCHSTGEATSIHSVRIISQDSLVICFEADSGDNAIAKIGTQIKE